MGLKAKLAKPYAAYVVKKNQTWIENPIKAQQKIFRQLISQAEHTKFGKEHAFKNITNYEDFKQRVPIRTYEDLKPYIDQIINGEYNVLWKGRPLYFAKTSGTTSGTKYIPISKESMPYHIIGAKHALLHYIYETGKSDFVNGKMIFLQGSPVLDEVGGIKTGRLSGIAAHFVPKYLQKNRMPSWETNIIEDWETKVNNIVDETIKEDMTLISGIPSWVQTYFEKLIQKAGKPVGEIFPNFNLFVYGGLNFEPYRQKFNQLIGRQVDTIELYPASEGFFAYQDKPDRDDLLLLTNHGMFYEFVPADEIFDENPTRLSLAEVKTGVNYALILNTNAGLWGYNIGDTVMFTSTKPYKIKVTGRIKHFISAFGEHVIAKEVETAIQKAISQTGISINEFTVAPQINPKEGLPYHEWLIEFENTPNNLTDFAQIIDESMQEQNVYYKDLISGKILRPLVITPVKKGGFDAYMKSIGKLGGQNKIPRLSDNRKIADRLYEMDLIKL
jgi:hypothetical protein